MPAFLSTQPYDEAMKLTLERGLAARTEPKR